VTLACEDAISKLADLVTVADFLSYIFIVSEEYKDYTFDYDDMAG